MLSLNLLMCSKEHTYIYKALNCFELLRTVRIELAVGFLIYNYHSVDKYNNINYYYIIINL